MRRFNWKKISKASISFLLTLCMMASVTACGKTNPTDSTNASGGAALTTGAVSDGTAAVTEAPINIDDYMVDLTKVNYKEYINAEGINSIVIKKSEITATEAYIKYTVNSTAMSALGSKEVERTVEAGDTVTLDYTGYINGIAFQGGTATGATLGIGSETFIEGFETGLIGAKIGEEVTLKLKFPENYSAEPSYAGKDCEFKATVTKITTVADVDDATVLSKTGYSTYAEYAKSLEESAIKDYREGNIWKKFVEAVEVIKDHDGLVEEYYMMNLSMIDAYATYYGVTRAVYLSEAYGIASEEAFKQYLESYAKQYAKQKLTVLAIADIKGLTCTTEEFNAKITELATENTVSEEDIRKEYTDSDIIFDVEYKKVFDYMYAITPQED